MLGELLTDSVGQTTGLRVLPAQTGLPQVEVSFESEGTILGVHCTEMGTYAAVARPDGTMFGEGQGVLMTEDAETVLWTGSGVGHMLGRGQGQAWRGAIYFQTASQRLARLNGVAGVFEFNVDEGGKTEAKVYAWE
jgi:hypothetical protein